MDAPDERVFLQDDEVSVTGTRLEAAGDAHDLAGVSAATLARQPAAATGPILMIVAGLLCLLSVTGEAGWTGGAVGAGLLVGAGVWWRLKQPTFQVRLESLEGELTAYESRDEERAGRVLSAVQQALEARP